uniref:Uncharacterized protein n=1 Tax=Timema genevievae TaxID=629358 RepID=A0A7R9PL31_TIMGE|nr:unnamed protein product [Timema genevievae]
MDLNTIGLLSLLVCLVSGYSLPPPCSRSGSWGSDTFAQPEVCMSTELRVPGSFPSMTEKIILSLLKMESIKTFRKNGISMTNQRVRTPQYAVHSTARVTPYVIRPPKGRVENYLGKTILSTPDWDLSPDLPIISSLIYCGREALDHADIESKHVCSTAMLCHPLLESKLALLKLSDQGVCDVSLPQIKFVTFELDTARRGKHARSGLKQNRRVTSPLPSLKRVLVESGWCHVMSALGPLLQISVESLPRELRNNNLIAPNWDRTPIPVPSSPVYCESSALDHAVTKEDPAADLTRDPKAMYTFDDYRPTRVAGRCCPMILIVEWAEPESAHCRAVNYQKNVAVVESYKAMYTLDDYRPTRVA